MPAEFRQSLNEDLLTAVEGRDVDAAEAAMRAHYEKLDLNVADLLFGTRASG